MKKLLLACFITIISISINAQQKNVLFIGNSYTGVNDLPSLVKNVALSLGDTIFTDSNTPGGYTFNLHSTNATTLSKIAQGTWDYVILQAQSQEPSFPPSQVASQTYPYAASLVNAIRQANSCTEPVFYMTWGRKNGDAANCASYAPLCTYEGMQQRLRESYMEMSLDNSATTSPVGVAWKNFRDAYPTVELYTGDESHPSIYGSYLAACVFYATLYQKSPIGATYIPSGINASDALNIQTIASNTVLDSLDLWRINANKPIADFSYSGNGIVNFTNTSTNSETYSWDFGDGNTSTLESPTNTFSQGGNNTVELVTFSIDSCFSDTISKNVNVISTGINNIPEVSSFVIFPNPANKEVTIQTLEHYTSVNIIDVAGKAVKQFSKPKNGIDISSLTKGVYFVQIFNGSIKLNTIKLLKN
jgi:PKD repeat protein